MADRRRPGYQDVQPVTELVTLEEVHEAMLFMDSNAYEYGKAAAAVDLHIDLLKRVEAILCGQSGQKSNDQRMWEARASSDWRAAAHRKAEAIARFEELKLKMKVADLRCRLFQTGQADKRIREVGEPARR